MGNSAKDVLRRNGIYQLPNGRELLTLNHKTTSAEPLKLSTWGADDEVHYEVDGEGRLVVGGKLTAWDVKDLMDTGRSASPAEFD